MTLVGLGVSVLQAVLGIALLVSGGTKLADEDVHVDQFDHFGYPQWFRTVTGGLEVAAAVALFVGTVWRPELALLGGALAAAVLAGAAVTHLRVGDPVSELRGPGVLLAMAVLVAVYRTLGVV